MSIDKDRIGLEQYQWKIYANKLYKVRKLNSLLSNQQVEPNIMINKGKVNIYGLNSSEVPASVSDMICPECNKGIEGFAAFGILPCYLYCEADGSYETDDNGNLKIDIILSGIEVLQEIVFPIK